MAATRRYAERTNTSTDASKVEIEKTLRRYGAKQFTYGWDQNRVSVAFQLGSRRVLYRMVMPDRDSNEFTLTPSGKWGRDEKEADAAWERACRQKWRALALIIKAKLEAVDSGITTLEDEFLSGTMLPDGSTVGEWIEPQIEHVYRTGGMPQLLPGAAPRALPGPQVREARG